MNDLVKQRRLMTILFGLWSTLVLFGAGRHLLNGTFDQLPLVSLFSYMLSFGAIAFFATCMTSHYMLQREIKASEPYIVKHHLDYHGPLEIDKWGFRLHQDWQWVSELEHELGFVHGEESGRACAESMCWAEDQRPEYEWDNGFLAIKSFPAYNPSLKIELLTPNERRAQSDAKAAEVARYNKEFYHKLNAEKKEELEYKYQMEADLPPSIKDQHREYESLMKVVEASFNRHNMIVLPDGYNVTYSQGGEMANVQTPTGLIVHFDVESWRRPRPTLTAVDRRRDVVASFPKED